MTAVIARWIVTFLVITTCQHVSSRNILNTCMKSQYHKNRTSAEPDLVECAPWKGRSCCTPATVKELLATANEVLYDFKWNHCGNLSSKCYRYMMHDSCFYECSPNVGPWIVNASSSRRTERFMNVPLCASECDAWFAACENDKTCSGDWRYDWQWINRSNHCRPNKPCRTFREMFKTSKSFCESIWHYSFKYTPDDQKCMKTWFNGTVNPNDAVAKYYYSKINSSATISAVSALVLLMNSVAIQLLMRII